MYAVVRDNQYDPDKLAQGGQAQLDEFQALHDRQPGALGTLVADAGNYRWITINLWDSQEHAAAALPGLIPYVQRLIEPQLAGPSQLITASTFSGLQPKRISWRSIRGRPYCSWYATTDA